jgi:SAM-dependent methyltransferase
MSEGRSQQPIWAHFQREESAYAFEASHPRHAAILSKLRRLADSAQPRVLNIGIGDGNFERIVQALGWTICSLDPDADAVGRLRERGVQAETGFIDALPFPDEQFEFVVASEVLEHLTPEERRSGLDEIRRTLRPGGYFLGTVPYQEDLKLNIAVCPKCGHVFHRWGHTTSFDLESLRQELSPCFVDVSCHCTAFVAFRGRSATGKLKSLVRLMLARRGAAIAMPNIFFQGRKP